MRSLLRFIGRQTWIRFGIRNRIIRLFHDPGNSQDESFEVPFFGLRYEGNMAGFIDWNVYYFGSYCPEELKLFADLLSQIEEPVSLDVGANVGHHSIFLSRVSKHVTSFEPFDKVARQLEQKQATNNLTNLSLCKFALGAKQEVIEFTVPDGSNTGTGSFLATDGVSSPKILLPVRVGDDYVIDDQQMERVSFIKVDTEGFERFVLEGLKRTLHRDRPIVFFEWSDEYRSAGIEFGDLFPANYRFFEFISDVPVGWFFRKPNYQLRHASPQSISDNILALPQEYIDRLLHSVRRPTHALPQANPDRLVAAIRTALRVH